MCKYEMEPTTIVEDIERTRFCPDRGTDGQDETSIPPFQLRRSGGIIKNNELAKVYDWLAVNKLSLNIRKTKYVIFHAINKRTEGVITDSAINGIPLERIQNFNFLGLLLNENMFGNRI